jgi:hypothetical protein
MQDHIAAKNFVPGSFESPERWAKDSLAQCDVKLPCPVQASDGREGGSMDIPDELNRLMAELKQATKKASETGPLDRRPTASEIDQFLSQYGFDEDVVIERIEITDQDVFQFYLFAAWRPEGEELSLFQMTDRG